MYAIGCTQCTRTCGLAALTSSIPSAIRPFTSLPSLHPFTYPCVCVLFLRSLTVEPCDGGGVGGDARMLGAGHIRRGGEGEGGGGDHRGVTKEVSVAGGATRRGVPLRFTHKTVGGYVIETVTLT